MSALRTVQVISLAVAALIFVVAVLIGLHVLPYLPLNITVGGLNRVAQTFILFSIALGLIWLVYKK